MMTAATPSGRRTLMTTFNYSRTELAFSEQIFFFFLGQRRPAFLQHCQKRSNKLKNLNRKFECPADFDFILQSRLASVTVSGTGCGKDRQKVRLASVTVSRTGCRKDRQGHSWPNGYPRPLWSCINTSGDVSTQPHALCQRGLARKNGRPPGYKLRHLSLRAPK